jgi:hypothetical protein
MERWILRAVFDLQKIIRCPLDVLSDLVAMCGTEQECSKNEHI